MSVDDNDAGLEDLTLTLAGRGGGASGGGGRAGGKGSAFRMVDNGFCCELWSSSNPSLALGTMSDRTSRSSEERARELRTLEEPEMVRLRENRVRNRDTADGAPGGGLWESSTRGSGASAYETGDSEG